MHAVLRMTQNQIERFARSSNAVHDSPDWKAGRIPEPETQESWLIGGIPDQRNSRRCREKFECQLTADSTPLILGVSKRRWAGAHGASVLIGACREVRRQGERLAWDNSKACGATLNWFGWRSSRWCLPSRFLCRGTTCCCCRVCPFHSCTSPSFGTTRMATKRETSPEKVNTCRNR